MRLDFTVPSHFEAEMGSTNQHSSFVAKMKPVIEHVKVALHEGGRLSSITIDLFDTGIKGVMYLAVIREATGANIGDLKGFGRWWSDDGVTDNEAYDRYADEISIAPFPIDEQSSLLPYQ